MPKRLTQANPKSALLPVDRGEHLSTRVAREIRKKVINGSIQHGEKLPPEHFLAEKFGVSRSVLREAIAQLRNEGLIETRQGVGAFASFLQTPQVLRMEPVDGDYREAVRCLYQLRIPLEEKAAGLAAMHHTEDDLVRIDRAFQQMASAEDTSAHAVVADLAFHRAIAASTQNRYFPLFVGFILERIDVIIRPLEPVMQDVTDTATAEHAEIRDALHARDAKRAEKAMRKHLDAAAKRLGLALGS